MLQAGAPATTDGIAGSVFAKISAPTSPQTVEAAFALYRGAEVGPRVQFGTTVGGFFTDPNQFGFMWLGNGVQIPGNANWSALSDGGSVLYFNAPGELGFYLNGVLNNPFEYISGNGVEFFGSTEDFGGATGVILVQLSTVLPTGTPYAGGILIYSNAGAFETFAPSFQFSNLQVNPVITQNAPATDVATTSLIIQGQPTLNVAAINIGGGNLILQGGPPPNSAPGFAGNVIMNLLAPTSGNTTEAYAQVTRQGVLNAQIGAWLPGSPTSYTALWLGPGIVPSSSNANLITDGSSVLEINIAAGSIFLQVANVTYATVTTAGLSATLAYSPGVPGNWASTPPSTVQQALDRIAANTTNTHPIP